MTLHIFKIFHGPLEGMGSRSGVLWDEMTHLSSV